MAASTGGYHHRQRVCQPFGLEKAQRLPFGYKPGGLAQPLPGSKAPVARLFKPPEGPEGRHNLDLVARQNPAKLGCVTIRDSTELVLLRRGDSSDCSLCSWDSLDHRLKSQQDLRLASLLERQAVPCRPSVQPRSPSVHHNQSGHHIPSVHHSSVAPKWANKHRVESVQNGTFPNCRTSIARRSCTYRIRRARAG